MRYKTSCFNPTLAGHNLKRFWPLPVAILAFFVLVMVANYHTSMLSGGIGAAEAASPWTPQAGIVVPESEAEQFIRRSRNAVYTYSTLVIIVQLFTAIFSAMLVMLHIHSRKQIQFYHGLPLSRRCIYITNVATGYVMGLGPVLLAELIMGIIAVFMGAEVFPVLQLMGVTAASFTIYYAIAVIACVLGGQSFGALLLYGGMNCVAVAISAGASGIARYILPGYTESFLLVEFTEWLTPVLKLVQQSLPLYKEVGLGIPYGFAPLPFVAYTVAGVLLLVLGGFLYQIRKGETAGEMISFPFIRMLSKVLVALMAALAGTVALVILFRPARDMSFPLLAVMVVVLLVVGWIAAEMVIRKTFRVFRKRSAAQCLSLAALVLLILVGAKGDVFGYVNHTPDLTKVSECQVMLYGTSVSVDAADALEFHEFVLGHRDELGNGTSRQDTDNISLNYYNEDGENILSRTYYVKGGAESPVMQKFLKVMSTPDYVYQSWFTWQDTQITEPLMDRVQLCTDRRYLGEDVAGIPYLIKDGGAVANDWIELTAEEGMKLYDAVLRDIQAGNLKTYYYNYLSSGALSYGNLEFHVYSEVYDASFGTYEEYLKQVGQNYHNIAIYPEMTHTLQTLESLGFTVNPEALK